MANFEFIAVRPDNIQRHWGQYADGVKAVIKNSTHDLALDAIYNNLLSGQWQLWAGYRESQNVGFIISYVANDVFFVVQAYIKPGTDRDIFFDGMSAIEEKARQVNLNEVEFWTIREEAFEKRMNDKGYKKGYTQFKKKLY